MTKFRLICGKRRKRRYVAATLSVHMQICIRIHKHIHTLSLIHSHTLTNTHTYTHTQPHTHLHVHFPTHILTHVYHKHTHLHTHASQAHIHMHMLRTHNVCVRSPPPLPRRANPRPGPCTAVRGRSVGRPGGSPALSRRVARPAGRGDTASRSRSQGGVGRGWLPVRSAGEVSNRSPRPGRYPPALPGPGRLLANFGTVPAWPDGQQGLSTYGKMRWQCEMVMWFGVSDVFARICTV